MLIDHLNRVRATSKGGILATNVFNQRITIKNILKRLGYMSKTLKIIQILAFNIVIVHPSYLELIFLTSDGPKKLANSSFIPTFHVFDIPPSCSSRHTHVMPGNPSFPGHIHITCPVKDQQIV